MTAGDATRLGVRQPELERALPASLAAANHAGWAALEIAFAALGRALLVLDSQFRILRASKTLDTLACPHAAVKAIGRPIRDLLDTQAFDAPDELRIALNAGGREEGRRAFVRCGEHGARLVSLTVAALPTDDCDFCDPLARYLVVLRPAEDDALLLHGAMAAQGVVARSEAMIRIVHLVENLHRSDVNVLITGESGSGKEVVARAVHAMSPMRAGPFVGVNCAALPGDLLESELFGHVRGAFTGAVKDRVGRLELARGGTLFLDEIGEMPPQLQVKLLRVLQERSYERVGESHPRKVEARIIAATNADLPDAVRAGRFRDDLYYRLRVVPIHIPPLSERTEDIEPLARHLLARIAARHNRTVQLSPDALRYLLAWPWPGNVRELENALEYAVAFCKGQTLQVEDLPLELRDHPRQPQTPVLMRRVGATVRAGRLDAADLLGALHANKWNRADAATSLGLSRTTLWRRMRALGLDQENVG